MNYPLWLVPYIGSGWVIGIIAIFHVTISQFAVGGGFYLAMAEQKALREGRRDKLEVVKRHSRFFLILTSVFGTVSGVGIWFAIGLANPEATSTLIHNFVFAWAMEWMVFLVELTTIIVYYYTWGRVSDKRHLQIAWLYAISTFFTLFIINGILTFKLSPGAEWLAVAGTGRESSQFWNAIFNPGFWPSLFLRMGICCTLAGVFALTTCSRIPNEGSTLKADFIGWTAKWLLPLFFVMPLLLFWFFHTVPHAQHELLKMGISTAAPGVFTMITRMVVVIIVSSITLIGVVYFTALRSPGDFTRSHAVIVILLATCLVGSLEYVREMMRKPYVVVDHMYSNGIRVDAVKKFNQEGYLTHALWIGTAPSSSLAKGEAMFRGQCMSCHTISGYRPIKTLLGERDRTGIANFMKVLHDNKPDSPYFKFMPPLVGTPGEIEALGDYLNTLTQKPTTATTHR